MLTLLKELFLRVEATLCKDSCPMSGCEADEAEADPLEVWCGSTATWLMGTFVLTLNTERKGPF